MTTQVVTNWKKEWFEIEDATYLNTAAHTVMPRVSIRAVEHALEAKKFPHRVDESVWFEAPVRIRKSLSKMIGAKPEEIAVTTGASAGAAVLRTASSGSGETRSSPCSESSRYSMPPGSPWKNGRA